MTLSEITAASTNGTAFQTAYNAYQTEIETNGPSDAALALRVTAMEKLVLCLDELGHSGLARRAEALIPAL